METECSKTAAGEDASAVRPSDAHPAGPPDLDFQAFADELDAIYGTLNVTPQGTPQLSAAVAADGKAVRAASSGSLDSDIWPFTPPVRHCVAPSYDSAAGGGQASRPCLQDIVSEAVAIAAQPSEAAPQEEQLEPQPPGSDDLEKVALQLANAVAAEQPPSEPAGTEEQGEPEAAELIAEEAPPQLTGPWRQIQQAAEGCKGELGSIRGECADELNAMYADARQGFGIAAAAVAKIRATRAVGRGSTASPDASPEHMPSGGVHEAGETAEASSTVRQARTLGSGIRGLLGTRVGSPSPVASPERGTAGDADKARAGAGAIAAPAAVRNLASGLLSHANFARKAIVEEAKELAQEARELAGELRQGAEITVQETSEMRESLVASARERAATAAEVRKHLVSSARERAVWRGMGGSVDGAQAPDAVLSEGPGPEQGAGSATQPAGLASHQTLKDAFRRRAQGLQSGLQQARRGIGRIRRSNDTTADGCDDDDKASDFTIGDGDDFEDDLDEEQESFGAESWDEHATCTTVGTSSPVTAAGTISDGAEPISEFKDLGGGWATKELQGGSPASGDSSGCEAVEATLA